MKKILVSRYLTDVLGTNLENERLFSPISYNEPLFEEKEVVFTSRLAEKISLPGLLYFDKDWPSERMLHFRLGFYGNEVIRLLVSRSPSNFTIDSPMLAWDPSLIQSSGQLETSGSGWRAANQGHPASFFAVNGNAMAFSPDGGSQLAFQSQDHFVENLWDSLPLALLERKDGTTVLGFSLQILPGERFCGTGERFERPDLFGQQIDLVNVDAAGVNNPRAYKNIPLLLSSRGYGIFIHSSAHMRLDIGAHSTRALQWLVEDEQTDIFFIGGGTPERVLYNYRRITGFPALPPIWSFGTWMSRCSYHSADQVRHVALKLRKEGFPADVIHLDTGWFEKDWFCDWKFSKQAFPDPGQFVQEMDDLGYHISLWQYPHIRPEIDLAAEALANGYSGEETGESHRHWLGYTIDFTNPAAVAWYQGLLESLLAMGVGAIKTDFGEEIDPGAHYDAMDAAHYHNLFALLYQKAAWEISERVHGKGNAVIWARAGWAGCQRYPVHWGGDAAATFDGLAGTIRGGLHLGLSGFAFWSHDVGGIHGIPDFETSRPSDAVYVRWTQVGVFSSHIRFHGGTPREPWEFPAVADIVRQWLRLRYALLPYILQQARSCAKTGLPMFRSLIFDWYRDPAVWSIEDEYLFGDSFLVCPVMNEAGVRDVYLPEGKWVDFWSGAVISGPAIEHSVISPLERLPLFVRYGQSIPFAEPVETTRQLEQARKIAIRFDESYPGFDSCPLAGWMHF